MYKVLITTSGTGSRLGSLTKNLNKALIPIAGKPTISYIIDKYPKEIELIITTGYLENQIKTQIPILYPNRKITFVTVDKYNGPGSSLAYSMLQAKNFLQCPFIYSACDTIIIGKRIPDPDNNWIAGYPMEGNLNQYRTIQADRNNKITKINEKGEGNSKNVLIGLFGIKDYPSYWRNLRNLYDINHMDQTLNDTSPFNQMIKERINIELIQFPIWLDTGNPKALEETQNILEK
jgi:NDP-sugar pyrophosphorylase family protein